MRKNAENDHVKILVTGGSGFLGRHLVSALEKAGYDDIVVFNRKPCEDLRSEHVSIVYGDLQDANAVEKAIAGCEAVFHVAAKAGVWGPYREYYQANVVGTQNIIQACLKHNVRYLVYTSSPSVAFRGQPLVNASEKVGYGDPRKMCAYAKTKMLAEKLVLRANGEKNLQTVALRPHLIWGPGDNHLIPTILKAARQRRLFQVGSGDNWVDISYVTNVAQAHLLALKELQNPTASVAGRAFFISQGDPVQLWPWLKQLLKKLDAPQPLFKMPTCLAYILGAMFELLYKLLGIKRQPPMTRFVAKELSQSHYFDISAAKMDLHYIPQISNEEGMELLIAWMKQQQSSKA